MTHTRRWRRADGTGLTVELLDDRAVLRLYGEVDMLRADALREAIAALPAGVPEIHLELAELKFIDVGGTRQLITLARRLPPPGLILHQPPRSLLLLIRLLWPGCRQAPAPSDAGAADDTAISIYAG